VKTVSKDRDDGREWLRKDEVASAYGLTVRTVERFIKDRRLPARRIVGTRLVRIHRDDARRLLEPRE
jgi:excisionase family DNA binding protein